MDMVSTAINAAVVGAVGLILAWLGKGRFDAIDRRFDAIDRRFEGVDRRFEGVDRRFEGVDLGFEGQGRRIDRLEERIEHRIDGLESKVDARLDRLQSSVEALRSDLTQVALAVGVRRRATNA